MIDILPNVVEVIVLPAGSNALLRIDSPLQLCQLARRITHSLEDGFKLKWTNLHVKRSMKLANYSYLTHSSVGEQQSGIVFRQNGGRVMVGVSLLICEELHE